jgi:uncharacterized protein YegJ (DUF2314 family)
MIQNWKTRGRLYGLAVLAASFVNANAGYSVGPASAGTGGAAGVATSALTGPQTAQDAALQHLSQFMTLALNDASIQRNGAGVKVAVALADGRVGDVWVTPKAQHNGEWVGIVADQIGNLPDLELGERVTFGEAEVRDWYFYGRNGKMYGNFTTRHMMDNMTPSTAAMIAQVLSVTPVPVDW